MGFRLIAKLRTGRSAAQLEQIANAAANKFETGEKVLEPLSGVARYVRHDGKAASTSSFDNIVNGTSPFAMYVVQGSRRAFGIGPAREATRRLPVYASNPNKVHADSIVDARKGAESLRIAQPDSPGTIALLSDGTKHFAVEPYIATPRGNVHLRLAEPFDPFAGIGRFDEGSMTAQIHRTNSALDSLGDPHGFIDDFDGNDIAVILGGDAR